MVDITYRTAIELFEQLEGERVIVRPYRPEDAAALQEAVSESREHIRPWLPFAGQHQTVEESRDWIIQQKANWLLRKDMILGIWEKETRRFLGGTGFHPRDWESRFFEIGYWLRKSAEGRGYMAEAVKLQTQFLLDKLKANRVEIRCDARNQRSAAVAKRLGYRLEGTLRNQKLALDGTLANTLIFSLIPSDPRPF